MQYRLVMTGLMTQNVAKIRTTFISDAARMSSWLATSSRRPDASQLKGIPVNCIHVYPLGFLPSSLYVSTPFFLNVPFIYCYNHVGIPQIYHASRVNPSLTPARRVRFKAPLDIRATYISKKMRKLQV